MARRLNLLPFVLIAPTFLVFALILGYPWVTSFLLSFQSYSAVTGFESKFVGLNNYYHIFRDPLFWLALENTVYFAAPSVLIEFLLGLGGAVLISRKLVGERLIRTAVVIPMMMAPALVGLLWKLFVNPDIGLLNYFLELIGLQKSLWYASPALVIPTMMIVEIWQNTPFVILMMTAGLQAIPGEQYEAAKIDGASSWQMFRRITIPWLKPLIAVTLMFRTIFIIRTFESIMILIGSPTGIGNSAILLGTYLYTQTFQLWDLGLGSAISYVVTLLTFVLTAFYLSTMYKEIV